MIPSCAFNYRTNGLFLHDLSFNKQFLCTDRVIDARPDGQDYRSAYQCEIDGYADRPEQRTAHERYENGDELQGGLGLADDLCGDDYALAGGKLADAADENFTGDYHECKDGHEEIPEAHNLEFTHHDERSRA